MARRASRRTTWVVAAVAALLLAAGIGRLTAPDSHPPRTPIRNRTPAPYTTTTAAGVPVGYSRTREGAVAAMAAYGQMLADPRVQLDDTRRRRVVAAIGTERYIRALDNAQAAFAARRDGPVGRALRPGARAVFVGVPVAFRVLSYDGSSAVIISWGVAIAASDTGLGPEATWGMTTTTAVWEHGDWKVDRVRSRPGPAPMADGTPSSAETFLDDLSGMRTLRYAP